MNRKQVFVGLAVVIVGAAIYAVLRMAHRSAADAWGRFLAQVAEWVVPFGRLVDLIFGAPLLALVGLAPSVRAARRDLRVRRERVKAEREAERIEDEFERVQRERQEASPE